MNSLLLPMWALSGALFPAEKAPLVLKAFLALNPMTYGIVCVRASLLGGTEHALVPALVAWALLSSAAVIAFVLALQTRDASDLI